VEVCQAVTGQQISFTDQSTISSGALESWSWAFGDGSIDNSGPNVTHTYDTEGAYNVSLRVGAGEVSRQVNKVIEVTTAPEPEINGVVLPFVVQGQGALDQVTLLYIHNPDNTPMPISLSFRRRPAPVEGDPGPVTLTLAAGETIFYPDVLQDPFGLDNVNGSLLVEPLDPGNSLPVVFGFHRTFQEDGSSFGQGVPGVTLRQFPKSSDDATNLLHLTGLSDNSNKLGFFGVTNPTDSFARFQLRFYDRNGVPIGTDLEPLTVAAFGQRQFQVRTIRDDFGVANQTDYRVDLELLDGGPIYPYATVLNLGSEDPTFVRASDPTLQKVFIIGALATAGLNNTQWQTDAVLTNVNEEVVGTEVSFINVGNGAEPLEAQRLSLQSGETLRLENVLADRWGLSDGETLGLLTFTNDEVAQGPFPLIQAETYDSADPLRRFGQFMPAFTTADAAQEGERQILTGLQQDGTFRTTIWVVNPGETGAEYDLIYRAIDGAELGRISGYRVGPGKMRQINPSNHAIPFQVVAKGFTVQIIVRSGSLLSAAQVVINATNDPAFVPGVTR
jgi:PKD repeat protein